MTQTDDASAGTAAPGPDRSAGFQLLLSSIADVLFETDAQGRLIGDQSRWEAFSGQTPAQWAGLGWADAVHPEDREHAMRGWAVAVAAGAPYQNEYRLRRADGAWRWMRLTSAPVREAGGAITRWVGMFTDVTDLHDLNARLAEQTRRFERALANSAITVFEQDRDLRYNWVHNPALGADPATIVGKTDADMLDSQAAAELERLKRQVLATGEPLRAEVTAQPPGVPVHHFDLQVEARRDASGAIDGVICAAFDITDRKATEAALKASEARYRLLFEQSVDGICVIDDDGAIVDVNPSCCQLFGHDRAAFLQLAVRALLDPAEAPRLAEAWEQLEKGEAIAGEWLFRRRDGSSFIGEITGRRLAGQLFQGIVRDVTERKRTETWLQGAHQTFSALVDRSPFGIYIIDADFRILQVSDGARTVFAGVDPLVGRDLAEALQQIWAEPFASEAIAQFRHTLATGESFAAESIERRADNQATEAYDWRIERITLPDGRPGVVCHFYDLTERHRHDAHVALLMRELDHRARNMLTLVEAIARRTIAQEPRDFTERFSRRIQALAANQELLVRSSWRAVPLAELVRSQMAFIGDMLGSRTGMEGPAVEITPAASQTLGMALHELATNAVKHGALSGPAGRVSIRWRLTDTGADPRFHLEWRESDGPPVVEPERLGFGSTVIRRMVGMSFGCTAEVDFAPQGFCWRIDCRAEAVLEGESLRRLVLAGAG
jgi:PAS domain S-box-containing protein